MVRTGFLPPALALCLLLSLVACGGGGGGGGPAPAPSSGFQITGIYPGNGTQTFDPADNMIVTFSDSLESEAEAENNITLAYRDSGVIVPRGITMTVGRLVATIDPSQDLDAETWFTLRVHGTIRSSNGQVLGEDRVTHFRTKEPGGTPPPPPPPTGTGSIRFVGQMVTGRSSHVAELLPDGTVLVAGGFTTANSVTASAEIYDPSSETFSGILPMVNARGFQASAALQNGNIFVCGGVNGPNFTETNSTEIYNTSTGLFGASGTMNYQRAFHTATLLADGRVLIAGGTVPGSTGSFSSKTAEVFNPANGSFTILPEMSVYRAGHTATLLPDGKVLLAGGNGTDLRGELFDPASNTFSLVTGQMQAARRGHTATHLGNGIVLLMGGGTRTADLYVPSQDLFRSANSFPLYDRKDHTVSWTKSGRLFFAGGSYFSGNVLFFSQTTEYYIPQSGTFAPSQLILDIPKTRHRATELQDGSILITGGANIDSTQPELKEALLYEEVE